MSYDEQKEEYLKLADDIEDIDPELAEAIRYSVATDTPLVIEVKL